MARILRRASEGESLIRRDTSGSIYPVLSLSIGFTLGDRISDLPDSRHALLGTSIFQGTETSQSGFSPGIGEESG
jgi:hypothetical protein